MKKITTLTAIIFLTCAGLSTAEGVPLKEAQRTAEHYLELLKTGEYDEAYDAVESSNPDPEIKKLNLMTMEFFFDEYGAMREYAYKDSSPVGEEGLELVYAVTYDQMDMDKKIEVAGGADGIRITNVSDDASSPEALKKMVAVMKRLADTVREEQGG